MASRDSLLAACPRASLRSKSAASSSNTVTSRMSTFQLVSYQGTLESSTLNYQWILAQQYLESQSIIYVGFTFSKATFRRKLSLLLSINSYDLVFASSNYGTKVALLTIFVEK